ncbi:MAG: DUF305 domain-containing protein [Chloroflexota bacterium]|nr:DUF305 domain-containing protein [Chloroflexota bacterium]
MNGMSGMGSMSSMMGDVDRHFIEQMIPHHQAAIDMANLALQRAQHPELRALAADIKRTQTSEINQMRAWYKQWYGTDVPATPAGAMGGMMMGCGGTNGMSGTTDGSMSSLKNAADFDKAFIEQMIPHHQMALMMSQMVLMGGQKAELRTLVQSIITGQSAQITQMSNWYATWYGGGTSK